MEKQILSQAPLSKLLGIDMPIIMAPMFLVTNTEMIIQGLNSGITACIPALNFRKTEDLRVAIQTIKSKSNKPFGINLIVNKSNFLYKEQLSICCEEKVAYIITSLGSPEETIKQAHLKGVKVFCDVTDIKYAIKVEGLGADAVIAVNKEAGGHAGNISYKELIPTLKKGIKIPVISAGGVGSGKGIHEMLKLGADGLSIGSLFIATKESSVSEEYKQACVDYGADDIVMTTKLSGTPCSVIRTPYVEKIGTTQNWLEKVLSKNKKVKKWFKAFTFYKGMKNLENAAFSATYKTVWCAGPTIQYVKEIDTVKGIVDRLTKEYNEV